MISKKNKALASAVLAATMSATAIVPAFASGANQYATENGANESYAAMFESLYDDVIVNGEANGYMSKQNNGGNSYGIPYHSVETLCVEAPDYGHETTSEAMSYMAWITAMHDVLAKQGLIDPVSSNELEKGWGTLEAMIPGANKTKGTKSAKYETIFQQDRLKADPAAEENDPSKYPVPQFGGEAINPIYNDMKSAYNSEGEGYYLMHWLADVNDWYGFGGGDPGTETGSFQFINTFQRGEEESCFETVPQPCIEDLEFGMASNDKDNGNGIKAIFNGKDSVPVQYAFTNAPDAEDRAIQAIYFASQWGVDCGELSYKAAKMGDQCRNDMFDKYYKEIGCQNPTAPSASGNGGQHYLMSWYTSWGGAMDVSYGAYSWAWQIGCSHSHQFYQNPLAAYALAYDSVLSGCMKGNNAVEDYEESLKRQVEMYLWLQSKDGPFAGGCTNSKNGKYEKYGADEATFYKMTYVEHPVYADPGSNHWIGNQVWSTQRLAELYYYVKKNGDASNQTYGGMSLEEALEALLSRWIDWFITNTKFDYVAEDGTVMAYAIPSNLDWSGQPGTNWDASSKYDPSANDGLTCTITGYGQGDIGCVSSLCNTLIYYAAANGVDASAASKADNTDLAAKGLYLANKLMSKQWNTARDEIGIAYDDHNGFLYRVFEQEVYIPDYYKGTMPDGSKLEPGATFSSIRESYADDPMYQDAKAYWEGKGEDNNGDGVVDVKDYTFKLHRFWHMGDALMTTGTMALLYPEVKPLNDEEVEPEVTLWGDANVDGLVDIADATLILQTIGNGDKYKLSAQGAKNADVVDNGGGITAMDSLAVQMYDAKLFTQADFPTTSDKIS
ncbi:MAG: cellulose 1,4-beta-cellobiosidase [Ruminococcus sp.]|nr:cellulose 1,4-beta-cellobiosidase [Ruminococcus sp.]